MRVILQRISRKFSAQPVFTDITYTFENGKSYAILGGNGSGKSTLIKVIYGALTPSSGTLIYQHSDNTPAEKDKAPFNISIGSPYLELIEELTALEFLDFYQKFKPLLPEFNSKSLLERAYLKDASNKEIHHFSSGMKQRLRLALAICSDVSLILLDEPVSNLDPQGIKWYGDLIKNHLYNRTLIIGSNFNEDEISFCENRLELKNYK